MIRLYLDDASAGTIELSRSRAAVLSIGRGDGVDVQLPERFAGVSREHAVIEFTNQWYHLSNRSPNGTRLNGSEVQGPQPLREGDTIQLGTAGPRLIVRFEYDHRRWEARSGQPTEIVRSPLLISLIVFFVLAFAVVVCGVLYWGFS